MPSYRIPAYFDTGNLGDVIQSIALSRLLPQCLGFYRHQLQAEASDDLYIVNGWHRARREIPMAQLNCLFAGIHCSHQHADWLRGSRLAIGARDPFTQRTLASHGISSRMIGCASLTFDRHAGPRQGTYSVDHAGPGQSLSHSLTRGVSFSDQWEKAGQLLETYRAAAEVHTSRLHVALPCLAFGTPVAFHPDPKRGEPERYSLLDYLGVDYGKLSVPDISPVRDAFKLFLSTALQQCHEPHEPLMPILSR